MTGEELQAGRVDGREIDLRLGGTRRFDRGFLGRPSAGGDQQQR
jgi:hypothetical protein